MMSNPRMHSCRTSVLQKVEDFDASTIIGAPFPVILHNGVEEKVCSDCGAVLGHIIAKPKELVAVAAILRVLEPIKLSGSEIKFLRKSMGLKAKDLAGRIELSPEHLSRLENDQQVISASLEKFLRASVCLWHSKDLCYLELDPADVLSMKIDSVRSCSRKVALHLRMEKLDEPISMGVGKAKDYSPSKWHPEGIAV